MKTIRVDVTVVGRTLPVDFMAVNEASPYNSIVGKSLIHKIGGVPLTLHQVMKCIASDRTVAKIQRDQSVAFRCFNIAF